MLHASSAHPNFERWWRRRQRQQVEQQAFEVLVVLLTHHKVTCGRSLVSRSDKLYLQKLVVVCWQVGGATSGLVGQNTEQLRDVPCHLRQDVVLCWTCL